MKPVIRDSVDKIITTYFAAITFKPFTYKGKLYEPFPIRISADLARGYTCPAGCGGCCSAWTIDWLPNEGNSGWETVEQRYIEFNDKKYLIYSDLNDHDDRFCRYLRKEDGRCLTHKNRPMSCDMELTRFIQFVNRTVKFNITTKSYGRGWNMLRIDGERGAKCEILPVTDEHIQDTIRKFKRLKDWENYFEMGFSKTDVIIDHLEKRPTEVLIIDNNYNFFEAFIGE